MDRWMFAGAASAGCMLLCLAWARSLSRRTLALTAWARALLRIETGLSYRACTMEELLERAMLYEENRDVRGALEACVRRMHRDPLESLASAMEKEKMPELDASDRAALSPLWTALGTGGEADQRALLTSVRAGVDAQIGFARDKERRDHRLFVSLGVIGGGMVFLFLL